LANDAEAVGRMLTDDWAFISTHVGIGERAGFLGVIKSADFARTTLDLSDIKVGLGGNVAVVRSQRKTSGRFFEKNFNVPERQTDVLIWSEGNWKSVLTHETQMRED
jgi:Domain of unknown function (DUF4440)